MADESKKQIVFTENAPAPIGPYSQGVRAGNMLYVSGCIGVDPVNRQFVSDEVEGQARQVLQNMKAIVEAGGSSMSNVVKCTILLRDMADFAKVNAVYATFFPENPPARSTFAVAGLPMNALVEIESIAIIP
eukprot:TRINITY_DN2632_c0_g1_i1.p1 TRINITY_DN2632_c0_g1~~TRINITY_DN2632_c0_g1_i1.p1  ORF type:complete len:132 (-),score=44.00 TRINITY_DN2632_c0_g1_i1:106-501(-)